MWSNLKVVVEKILTSCSSSLFFFYIGSATVENVFDVGREVQLVDIFSEGVDSGGAV